MKTIHFFQIDTAMALTSLSNSYLSSDVNKFFNMNGRVTVNATLLFLESTYTSSVVIKRDIQKKLIEVIQARNNNIGTVSFNCLLLFSCTVCTKSEFYRNMQEFKIKSGKMIPNFCKKYFKINLEHT